MDIVLGYEPVAPRTMTTFSSATGITLNILKLCLKGNHELITILTKKFLALKQKFKSLLEALKTNRFVGSRF